MIPPEGLLDPARYAGQYHAAPVSLMTLRVSDLTMVDANQAYLDMVGMDSEQVIGRPAFEVFPESPTNPGGQASLRALMRTAVETGQRAETAVLRYDIPGPDGFVARWWRVSESPVLDADGEVAYLLHYSEDVTELVQTRDELAVARAGERRSSAQVASLADVALALTSTQSVEDLEQVVVGRGLSVLGSDGGGVVSRVGPDPADGWRVTISPALRMHMQGLGTVPYDHPLPAVRTARTGQRLLIGTRAEGLALAPEMQAIYDDTQRYAWACLPLVSRGHVLGCLAVGWVDERGFTAGELALMEGFAAQCATALDRIVEAERQRRTSDRVRHLAEALQRSMLTPPPDTDAVQLAVRYRPANDLAQVGGDWYDAFVQPDGDVVVVIGDVSGHDDDAAGKMGQVRGLLRALAYDDRSAGASPAAVLTRFEHVSRGLHVDELSTAVLARVAAAPDEDGLRLVRWSNAGNPPPVLVAPDGTTRLLGDGSGDLLLGVDPDAPRHDDEVRLPAGATLVLYTDGLIERRDASIDHGLDDLRAALGGVATAPLEQLCDRVLAALDPHTGEDDIAIVAVRV